MKTVIIGGVAGGASAAARLRRLDEKMEIVILERGGYISYANCGLPYYIGDVIKNRDNILLQTPEIMKQRFNIDVKVRNNVTKIDRENKKVMVQGPEGEYEETYDNLLIATGSSPLRPLIPGIDNEGIYTLWNVDDADYIKELVAKEQPKRAAVIGGGFIGLEMAENIHERGIAVSIIEAQDQVMAPIDLEMAQLLHENINMNNVNLYLGDGVKSFEKTEDGIVVNLSRGKTVEVDMVILSIGVRPNSEIAREAGLELNQKGGIVVDEYLKTSDPNIWAVGDVIEVENFITKEKTMIPLAGPANKQGRIVANNIAGDMEAYEGSMGTSVAQVFDLTVAATGVNEKTLKAKGLNKNQDYYSILISQKSHAGYYPQATPMFLKLLFKKDGSILGAQIVGQDGVDKRIDTIATTIRLGGSVHDLKKLELAYAPPYSSAKDPVNMLGFVADNVLSGRAGFVAHNELEGKFILDVGEDAERTVFSIPGSYHIPLGQLRDRMGELNPEDEIVAYCAIGVRSYNAARILENHGFKNVKILEGGTSFYKSVTYEIKEIEPSSCGVSWNPEPGADVIAGEGNKLEILDCTGMQCPGPIMKVNEKLLAMNEGDTLKVSATDMGFARDVESWCERTGNRFLGSTRENKENIVTIMKGSGRVGTKTPQLTELPQGKTIIVFDGDFDKAMASFIIANGAAAMGRPVTMFFTFWGLNILRKGHAPGVEKSFIEKMFGKMMPKGAGKLKLSNMNMFGMGTKMMKKVMKDKNVSSLEELMKSAMDNGVKLVACTMTMDIMGIKPEELIDGVDLGGVAAYLGDAENANVNLFI